MSILKVHLHKEKINPYDSTRIHLFKSAINSDPISNLIGKFPIDSEYLGVKQTDYGYRRYNRKYADQFKEFNKFCLDNFTYSQLFNFIEQVFEKPVNVNYNGTFPILHYFESAVPFEDGIHVDMGFTSIREKHSYNSKFYTILSPITLPRKGGRTVFIDDFGNELFIRAEIGDLIIFKSNTLHTIESFKGKRINMVGQFSIDNNLINFEI